MKIGQGVFGWDGEERRSNRYGSFNLLHSNCKVSIPTKLYGKRVRITCKVLKSRKSKHIGDLFLGIGPTQPEVGEVIELGVGVLHTEPCDWDERGNPTIILKPEDGRRELWIDPRKLYRLHDQTVEVFIVCAE